MPPKSAAKKQDKGQAKALEKQKQKVAEDKTFGLKNKNKSKAVQKFIKGVHQQVQGNPPKGGDAAQQAQLLAQKEEKKKLAQQNALIASLFKGTENVKKLSAEEAQKLTDPDSIKADQQIDLYVDHRKQRGKDDTMEDWDQEKLEQVIKTKHSAQNNINNKTDLVCKHFLDALEKRQYGWFWSCPGGGDNCKYRHCLPPGYVLKRDMLKEDLDDEEGETLEEMIERKRAALPPGGTKVTLETFKIWKEKKEKEKEKKMEDARLAESKRTGGRGLGVLSGRALFTYDPSLFVDDAAAAGEDDYEEDEAHWNQIINENQAAIDQANKEGLDAAAADRSSGDDSDDDDGESENEDENDESEDEGDRSGDEVERNKADHVEAKEKEQLEGSKSSCSSSSSSSASATAAPSISETVAAEPETKKAAGQVADSVSKATDTSAKGDSDVFIIRKDLFLEGDIPNLDELDV